MTDTVQQLHELPDLAAEVFLTWGHPNPSEQPVVQVKRIHPRAPADLDTLDALRPDELGLLHRLAHCVRAAAEAFRRRFFSGEAGPDEYRTLADLPPIPPSFEESADGIAPALPAAPEDTP